MQLGSHCDDLCPFLVFSDYSAYSVFRLLHLIKLVTFYRIGGVQGGAANILFLFVMHH
jgi:hypothetical protein